MDTVVYSVIVLKKLCGNLVSCKMGRDVGSLWMKVDITLMAEVGFDVSTKLFGQQ